MFDARYDLVIYNAKIHTIDEKIGNPEMIGISDGFFKYVGDYNENITKNAEICIDLKGKTVLPGFIDLHTHLWSEADEIEFDLSGIPTYQETIQRLKSHIKSKNKGDWVFASGWDESIWTDRKEFLRLEDLDMISPENPLYVRREDGHLVVVNSLALKLLPIDLEDNGVVKDEEGKSTGVLKDIWLDLTPYYKHLIPTNIEASCKIALSHGITAVVDNLTIMPEGQKNILESYFKLDLEEKIPIRIFLNPTRDLIEDFTKLGLLRNWGSSKVKLSGFKGFFDGAIGSETALINEKYVAEGGSGNIFLEESELIKQVQFAEENNHTICIHAIGDQAIERLLDCYEQGISLGGKKRSANKHRIEHAEMINRKQVLRAKKMGILLSMQPNFLKWEYPNELYEQRLGKARFLLLNRFNMVLKQGAHLSFGSDNMPLNPLFGIHLAVNFPSDEVRIRISEAIRAYTLSNAEALSIESKLGSITQGKFADFIVVDKSPFSINSESIDKIVVEQTYIGGKKVYDRKES
jgi:predicted amidohydrolase YtcJ